MTLNDLDMKNAFEFFSFISANLLEKQMLLLKNFK